MNNQDQISGYPRGKKVDKMCEGGQLVGDG